MISSQNMPSVIRPVLPIESRTDSGKLINVALLLILVCPIYYWVQGGLSPLLCFLAFVTLLVVFQCVRFQFNQQPHLLLNEKGIYWHHWRCGAVRWLDVKRVYWCVSYSDYLCLELFNEATYLQKMSVWQRLTKWFYTPMGVPYFSIPVQFLDRQPAEVYEIITAEIQWRRSQQPAAQYPPGA